MWEMNFDKNDQRKLLNDVIAQSFDEAVDLCNFVQTRVGKPDGSVVNTFWLGREHMISDPDTLADYIKLECER